MKPNPTKLEAELKAKADFNRQLENEFQELKNLEGMDKDDIDQALENAFAGMGDYGKYDYVKDEVTGKFVQKVRKVEKKPKKKTTDMGGK